MKKIDRNGFTIMELLIFSAIFGIVVGAIYMMYSTSHTTFTRGQNKIETQQNGRIAMERMAREIRTAAYDPSDALTTLSTTAIQAGNANDVTFIADVDGDNVTDQVRYSIDGSARLVRQFASWGGAAFPAFSSDFLADGVGSLDFAYFDGSDNAIAVPVAGGSLDDIRRITIQLTTQESDGLRTESFPLSMDVRLRNLQ